MSQVNAKQWQFTALDTFFFKESRPMEAIGGAQLQSVFPPPARTLIGAIRTAVGEAHQVDWKAYAQDDQHPLKATIGSADSLGPLSFVGPYLLKNGKRLFPVPLALLHAKGDEKSKHQEQFIRLQPAAKPTQCDLGNVRLPQMQKPAPGASPPENAWISADGLAAFLDGGVPKLEAMVQQNNLYASEERLGIGRDNITRTTGDGLLYQTRHVRPMPDVGVGMVVKGLNSTALGQQGTTRLGAEGRLAAWQCEATHALPTAKRASKQVLLVLLTPAQFKQGWLPDGFTPATLPNQQTVWEGVIEGVPLRLISAVTGKPLREGGWDLANHLPRTMQSLVPAGSCYFCEVLNGADAGVLNGKQLGQDTEYGRGEIAIGTW